MGAKTTLKPRRRKRATFVPCCFHSKGQTRPKRCLLCRRKLLVHLPSTAVTAVAQYCAAGAVKLRCVPLEELLRERAEVRPRRALT
jgi:hypothetical protein